MNKTSKQHPKHIRNRTGLNQHRFWSAVGVTQSGGSRYESGRRVPTPVRMLLTIAYGPEREAAKLATKMRTGA